MLPLKIHQALFVAESEGKGRGVFTNMEINPMCTVEISSVLVMDPKQRVALETTALNDYIFEWGEDNKSCCVAWGYISLYNHSYNSNCEYYMDYDAQTITIKTVRTIKAGEELTINYNGDWDDEQKLWFDAH